MQRNVPEVGPPTEEELEDKKAMIENFAQQHRLKIRRDECGDPIIPGKYGHIFEWSDTRLGVIYMPDGEQSPNIRNWNKRRRKLIAAGCKITQDADGEG